MPDLHRPPTVEPFARRCESVAPDRSRKRCGENAKNEKANPFSGKPKTGWPIIYDGLSSLRHIHVGLSRYPTHHKWWATREHTKNEKTNPFSGKPKGSNVMKDILHDKTTRLSCPRKRASTDSKAKDGFPPGTGMTRWRMNRLMPGFRFVAIGVPRNELPSAVVGYGTTKNEKANPFPHNHKVDIVFQQNTAAYRASIRRGLPVIIAYHISHIQNRYCSSLSGRVYTADAQVKARLMITAKIEGPAREYDHGTV
jgi:hypothetical protein